MKRSPSEEILMDGDKSVRFISNFGFAKAIDSLGKDVHEIALHLSSGKYKIDDVRDVLACSMVDVDGETLTDSEKMDYSEHLIEQYGLVECGVAARYICVAIQVGDVKKRKLRSEDQAKELASKFLPSTYSPFWKVGLLWMGMFLSSTIAACLITKLFMLPGA